MTSCNLWTVLGRLILLLLLAAPAGSLGAMDNALLGRWAYKAGSCEEDMTFKIAKDGLSGTEFFCAPQRIRREKGGWNIQFSCSGEGNEYKLRVHWRLLKNGRLRETTGGKTREYSRCSKADVVRSGPDAFTQECVACFNEAQQLGRSVGGFCRPTCVDVFSNMECDSAGVCRAGD